MGATFMQRTIEDTGANVGAIVKAFIVASELFDAEIMWKQIEELDLVVKPKHQIEGSLIIWSQIRNAVRWILNTFGHRLEISEIISQLKTDINKFRNSVDDFLPQKDLKALDKRYQLLIKHCYPDKLARNIAITEFSFAALDVVEIANQSRTTVVLSASTFFALGEQLNILWLRTMIEKLVVIGPWHAHARGVLRDELFEHHNLLTQTVLNKYPAKTTEETIKKWAQNNQQNVKGAKRMLQQMRSEKISDYATVMVAVRSINNLVVAANQ
jgi:glutamate dehydrogenase